jgi:hypothetical protein
MLPERAREPLGSSCAILQITRNKIIARLVTDRPTPYVLMAESLAELQARLPPGLERVERQPADLPEVVEIWFPHSQPGPPRGRVGEVRDVSQGNR